MTLTLLHKTKVSSLLNVYRNFGLNSRWLWGLIGVFDVGDLPVLTFGN